VHLGVNLDAEHLARRISAELSQPVAGGAEKDPPAETGIHHGVRGGPERPPDQKIGDLGIGVEGSPRLVALARRDKFRVRQRAATHLTTSSSVPQTTTSAAGTAAISCSSPYRRRLNDDDG
jgi:hypothetical protein